MWEAGGPEGIAKELPANGRPLMRCYLNRGPKRSEPCLSLEKNKKNYFSIDRKSRKYRWASLETRVQTCKAREAVHSAVGADRCLCS